MKVIISSNSDLPIYLQIVNQIKEQILSGKKNIKLNGGYKNE